MNNEYINKLNLLYIEDDLSIRNILSLRLEKIVNNLFLAKDGNEGYEKFLKHKPDLILTDITMPELNGIEMSRKIRQIDANIPIIVFSAHSDSSYLLDSIDIGINNYLIKPFNKDKLYEALERNAKMIYMDKINKEQQERIKEQQEILQNIINTEKSISFVTNFNEISFVNNTFLDFFNIKDVSTFWEKYEKIEDIFVEDKHYIHKGIIEDYSKLDKQTLGEKFYEMAISIDDTKRVVLIEDKYSSLKSFYLTISILEKDKKMFLINLTDITQMTIQKFDIEHKAYFDGLTNIYNRNKFDELFNKELLRAKRYKNPLSLAILDIDHFKKFNDIYGHMIGDEVLIMLANELNKRVRVSDIFARWGGEEFVVLFVETKIEDALKGSNKLREYISKIEHKKAGNITASFGVSEYKEGDTSESLFKRADEALYLAKEKGRNKVEFIS